MSETIGHYIAGEWKVPAGRPVGKSVNPANPDEVVCEFVEGTREDVREAIAAAQAAQAAWAATPAPARGRIVAKAAVLAAERAEEIARLMTREEGKLFAEASGEVAKGINLLEWYGGEGFRLAGKVVPSEMGSTFLYTKRIPLGVVGLITPWNFPWAIPCWKIAPAIVAGNTVVFKPAEQTPGVSKIVCEVFEAAGLPPGVLNMVVGHGECGAEISENEAVRAVSFTGSNPVGREVLRKAADRMAKVTLEMGGKNAAIIMDDANLDLAVAGVVKGAFGGTGQRCTATSRVVVHKDIAETFVSRLVEAAEKIKVGDGLAEGSGMGPIVDQQQHEAVLGFLARAKEAEGVTIRTGGGRPEGCEKGYFVAPTVITGVTAKSELWQEEVFGPVLSVAEAADFDEAIALANDSQYGLSSAFYSESSSLCMRYVDEIETGMVHVNSPTIGGEAQVPFGGIKATGYGEREMSEEGIQFFTELKTVWIDYTGKARTSNIY